MGNMNTHVSVYVSIFRMAATNKDRKVSQNRRGIDPVRNCSPVCLLAGNAVKCGLSGVSTFSLLT